MAYKEVSRVDVVEVIRRWQEGNSQRHIASGTGLSRDTVRKYLAAAVESGVKREGPEPTEEQLNWLLSLSRSGPRDSVAPAEDLLESWADQIYQWVTVDRLQVTRIQELLAQRGCAVSYTSLRRFLQRRNWRRRSLRTVRMENTPPGEVAELDFGRLGYIQDQESGRRRAVWALLVVLTYSRHSFLWPTYGQTLEEVISGLEAAWAFFGGIPRYLVVDNFPAAVAGADALHPRLTRGFLEYSQHRRFIVDPARVRHPKDKPMVERSVQYALYSVPSTLCPPGQQVEVGLGVKLVRIFHRGQLVKVHARQPRGGRSTDPADYPAELSAYTLRGPDAIKRKAAEMGPAVAEFAERLFEGPLPWAKVRQGHKLIRLGERYTPERLDAACRRALQVELIDVGRVERILVQALEQQETAPELPEPPPAGRFARPGHVFAHGKARIPDSTEMKTGGQP